MVVTRVPSVSGCSVRSAAYGAISPDCLDFQFISGYTHTLSQ